jgi:hypothetical protein
MTATQKTKITGLGYDENFGGIDLSGCPSLQPLASEEWLDPRFAPMDTSGQGHGSNALKRFLAEQIAANEGPTTVLASGNKFRVTYDSGAYHGEGIIDGVRHRFSATNREALLGKIGQAAKQNAYRALTKDEELQVIRACQSGDRLTGIGLYLAFSIGESRASKYNSPIEMMHDAQLIPIMNKCAEFCWFHCNPHALNSPAWHAFKDRILAGRPITFDLLDAIWLRYNDRLEEENESASRRQTEAPAEPETPREALEKLNALDDNEVDDLMQSTRQQFVREVRAGRR